MPAHKRSIDVQLAEALFGWTWREDWDAWCPPTWPAYTVHTTPPAGGWNFLLRTHGGSDWGIDDRGRPVVPSYRFDAEHTALIWDWLHTHHTTVTLDLTGTPLVCQVVGYQHTGKGTGESLGEAVCAAALAYARALTPHRHRGLDDANVYVSPDASP